MHCYECEMYDTLITSFPASELLSFGTRNNWVQSLSSNSLHSLLLPNLNDSSILTSLSLYFSHPSSSFQCYNKYYYSFYPDEKGDFRTKCVPRIHDWESICGSGINWNPYRLSQVQNQVCSEECSWSFLQSHFLVYGKDIYYTSIQYNNTTQYNTYNTFFSIFYSLLLSPSSSPKSLKWNFRLSLSVVNSILFYFFH